MHKYSAILFKLGVHRGTIPIERHVLGPVYHRIIHYTLAILKIEGYFHKGYNSICVPGWWAPCSDGSTPPWFCTELLQTNAPVPAPLPGQDKPSTVAHRGSWQHVLHSELVCSHGDAVDELHGAPEAMEFHTLIHVHHPIAGQGSPPDRIVQEGADPRQDNLKHGQPAAEAFFGQQVPFPCDCYLLKWRETNHKILVKATSPQNFISKNKYVFFSFTWFIVEEMSFDLKWGQTLLTWGSDQWKNIQRTW